ncbi:hypothetical protein FHT28_005473 [Rhizobium sp. SG570]|nr:hypothetical protein [Rhizobium sp. SG570]
MLFIEILAFVLTVAGDAVRKSLFSQQTGQYVGQVIIWAMSQLASHLYLMRRCSAVLTRAAIHTSPTSTHCLGGGTWSLRGRLQSPMSPLFGRRRRQWSAGDGGAGNNSRCKDGVCLHTSVPGAVGFAGKGSKSVFIGRWKFMTSRQVAQCEFFVCGNALLRCRQVKLMTELLTWRASADESRVEGAWNSPPQRRRLFESYFKSPPGFGVLDFPSVAAFHSLECGFRGLAKRAVRSRSHAACMHISAKISRS